MIDFSLLGAPLALTGTLVAVLCAGLLRRDGRGASLSRLLAGAGMILALARLLSSPAGGRSPLVRLDGFAFAWQGLFLLGGLAFLLTSRLSERSVLLLLGSLTGMCLLASADHFFLLFLGLELMSLPVYLLVHSLRPDRRSLEASLKYFFAGSAAGGMFLFGMALYYAATGDMRLSAVVQWPFPGLAAAGIALMMAGALFKIGAFPLHFWLPDAYEAAEPELSGFMSTAVKAAGFLLLLRVLSAASAPGFPEASFWLPAVSAATMFFGNLLALRQKNLQRLLAYSSIAHAGTLLAGVWAWRQADFFPENGATLLVYLTAYLFMNTGAFLALRLSGASEVGDLAGLGARSPLAGGFFILMLLSLGGVPPTGGFLAKFFIIWDLLRAGGVWLASAVVLNSLLALGYYFRLVRCIALEPAAPEAKASGGFSFGALLVMAACAGVTLFLGLLPWVRGWMASLLSV